MFHVDCYPRLGLGHERFAATGLASLGPANLNHVLTRGLGAKVVVIADDAVHFGARKVHGLGDQGHGPGGHLGEFGLWIDRHGGLVARTWRKSGAGKRSRHGTSRCPGPAREGNEHDHRRPRAGPGSGRGMRSG